MKTEANSAAPATAGAEFVHKPRQPHIGGSTFAKDQRYFGEDGFSAINGFCNAERRAAVQVMRFSGQRVARMMTRSNAIEGFSGEIDIELDPRGLREIARRLIDAAADIEAEAAAPAATAAEVTA